MATVTALRIPTRLRLRPRSLQGRLLLTYFVLVLLGVGGLIVWTGAHMRTAIIEQAEHDLELESLIIANVLTEPLEKWREEERGIGRPLDVLVRSYALSIDGRVTVVDRSLRVLLSSDESIPFHAEDNHPEIVAAAAGQEQHDIRWDEWTREERLFVAAPIHKEPEELDGIVQLSVPMAPIYAEIRRAWLQLVSMGGLVLLATVLVSLLLARQIAKPVQSLTTATEAMAAGHLEQRLEPAGPDEIERLGQAFNQMAERVLEILGRQQSFVANAAHELRSPLASLQLRIDMLQRHGQNDPELLSHYLHQMNGELDHLRRLVEHLLVLSRLDEGQELPLSSLDLAPLLYELADEMAPLVQAAGLRLQVDVPAHLPPVLTHPESIRIIVRNLLDNAIKYTPEGGQVILRAKTGRYGQTRQPGKSKNGREVDLTKSASRLRAQPDQEAAIIIEVADTGPGIPAEHLPYVFERFYRVEKTRGRRQGGAGLGLSLVRSIVEAHNGQITVVSSPGHGSTFAIRLPVNPA